MPTIEQKMLTENISQNMLRIAMKTRLHNWMHEHGKDWNDTIHYDELPGLFLLLAEEYYADQQRLCNHYAQIANDALGLTLPKPFTLPEKQSPS